MSDAESDAARACVKVRTCSGTSSKWLPEVDGAVPAAAERLASLEKAPQRVQRGDAALIDE